jgi:hypothetical protein
MKLEEMVCIDCFNLGPKGCQLYPEPMWHDTKGLDVRNHFCSLGLWWDEDLEEYVDRRFHD